MSPAMRRVMISGGSTKRSLGYTDGKQDAPTEYLTGVRYAPLDSVSLQDAERLNVLQSYTKLCTMVDGSLDIVDTDIFVDANSNEYAINAMETWAATSNRNDAYHFIVIESDSDF